MYRNQGFTLIELLVVVLIIGILAAVALPQYQKAVRKSRSANTFVLLRSLKDAEERHYLANGEYTLDLDALDITPPASCRKHASGFTCDGQGMTVSYGLSTGNFSHPNYYVVIAQESNPWIRWQWQLDHASVLPGRKICFPRDADGEKGRNLCKAFGGVECGAYSGWYPGVSKSYCMPD